MTAWRRRLNLRIKLTLWYVGAMVVVLGLYAASVYTVVGRSASLALDDRVYGDFQWAAEMADQRPDGTLTWFEGDDEIDSPWLQVWSPTGQLLYRSVGAENHPLPASASLAAQPDDRIVSLRTGAARYRLLSGVSKIGGRQVVIQVARSEAQMRRELGELMLVLAFGLPLGVAAAGLGGYSLARRALAPVDRMAERARVITAERLSERLPVDNPDEELGRLASVFNDTLGRLESSFEQMRRFTADVSHELRTPLTAIRSVGEVGLRGSRDERAYRAIIGSMLEDVDRLTRLVDRLLALSRAESGEATLSLDTVDLGDLAEDTVAHLGVLAEERRQDVVVERHGAATALVDRLVLRQALINLLDNAIKYTPLGGQIRIRVSELTTGAMIEVSDTGPGVGAEPRARIFDRFYRNTNVKPTDIGGAGLGLAIAKWAVEVNAGRLTLERASQTGSTFRISLPGVAAERQRRAAS